MIITQHISALEARGQVYTDIQIQPGSPLSYRAPRGYTPLHGQPAISAHDVAEFARFISPRWETLLDAGAGQFDASVTLPGKARLRCNFYRFGPDNELGCQIRRLSVEPPRLADIGAPVLLERILHGNSKGLVLITGPTGAGKSTTQAAMLDYLNENRPVNIVTIEQPIEYEHKRKRALFIRREVPTNVASFAAGVVAAKRQDPDVIMIGEMRDRDTAEASLQAAYSGHLVIATLHSRSAIETCEAMLNFFDDGGDVKSKRHLLASCLLGVVSQTLLPSADGESLVLAYEVLDNQPATAKLIRDNQLSNLPQGQGGGEALQPLNQVLAKLVIGKKVSIADARAAAYDRIDLEQRLGPHQSNKQAAYA